MSPVAGLLLLFLAGAFAGAIWYWEYAREKTIALDDRTLFSEEYGLVGRPDRIMKTHGRYIPEEWKSAQTVEPWHEVQLGVYFLLVEEEFGVRPPYGIIETGDGVRHRIKNTEELRDSVLEVAALIRKASRRVDQEFWVDQEKWKCRVCGHRSCCRQAKL